MIYHCDALLPTQARYASLKFRRYSRWFRPTRLDYGDALELVAFVETIGRKHAAYVFQWGRAGVNAYARLARHMAADAQPYIRANQASVGLDDGLAVLRAMQDGGWTRGALPRITKMSIQTLLLDHTQSYVARQLGLTRDQVVVATGRRGLAARASRAKAISALSIG